MKVGKLSVGLNPGAVALGAAAYLFGPSAMKIAGPMLRSVAKAGIKGGLLFYDQGQGNGFRRAGEGEGYCRGGEDRGLQGSWGQEGQEVIFQNEKKGCSSGS